MKVTLFSLYLVVQVRGRSYFFHRPFFRRTRQALAFIRSLFPQPYAVGLRCCDHGGQVTRWRRVMTWNRWHAEQVYREWDKASDGPPVWEAISFREFLRTEE